jgi:hypothetical protein
MMIQSQIVLRKSVSCLRKYVLIYVLDLKLLPRPEIYFGCMAPILEHKWPIVNDKFALDVKKPRKTLEIIGFN